MKTFKITLHCILITLTVLTSGCSRKNKQLSAIEIQESINEQIIIAKEYLVCGKNNEAISLLEDLLKQYPNMTNTIEALAFAHMDGGDPGLAAFYFEQIVKKAPSLHEYEIFAAQAYLDAKDYPQACRNYKNYLQSYPNDRSTWKALAKTYELDKKEALALDAYLRAEELTLSPSSEQDALKIARLCLKTKNDHEAKTWYHLVLTHNPLSVEARTRLLKIELQSGNWPEAQAHLNKLESLPTNKIDPGLITLAKDILLKKEPLKNTGKSITTTKTNSIKNDTNSFLKKGKEFKEKGDFQKSIHHYKEALSLNPKIANAWHELSLAYIGHKALKEAEASAKEAVNIEPENLSYRFNYLKIIKTNDSDEVLFRELDEARKHFPNNPEFTLGLAQAYHKKRNDLTNAKKFYEEFLKEAPNHVKTEQVRKLLSSL